MANNEENTSSPFTRPGFIVAAIVVAIVATLGITLAVVGGLNREEPTDVTASDAATSSPPTPDRSPVSVPTPDAQQGTGSICGLQGVETEGTLPAAPEAEWAYQGVIAYPTSSSHGPGTVADSGVRTCYQQTVAGALFMATNALSQGDDPTTSAAWAEAAISQGEYRDELLGEATTTATQGVRLDVSGYRVLSYDAESATIDLAVRGSSNGQNAILSVIYYLVWEDGDWKIDASMPTPLDTTTIPDLAGYTAWGV